MSDNLGIAGELMALYAKAGRRDDAARVEKEIYNIGITGWSPDVYLQIATYYANLDLADDMNRAFAKAIQENPNAEESAALQIYQTSRKLKDPAKRRESTLRYTAFLEKKIKENPYDLARVSSRAWALLRDGGPYDEVEKAAKQLAEVDWSLTDSMRLGAWAALRKGDAAAALAAFQSADRRSVEEGKEFDVDCCYGMGLALHKLGKREEAALFLRRGLAINSDYPEADEARAALQ
jgi:tetratricopeptide (TPR) repeat protein